MYLGLEGYWDKNGARKTKSWFWDVMSVKKGNMRRLPTISRIVEWDKSDNLEDSPLEKVTSIGRS